MEEKKNTSKIIVEGSNELTDLVREIHRSKAERIVLTFTEHTDILISPINLKVLLESAQREEKLLIAQIIQNPTGIRNAKLAGIKTIDTPSNPTEYDWNEAYEMIQLKKREKFERKKILETTKIDEDQKEVFEEQVENNIEEKVNTGYEDKRGIKARSDFIAIDGDIPKEQKTQTVTTSSTQTPPSQNTLRSFSMKRPPAIKLTERFKNFNKKKFLKVLLFTIIPIVFLAVIGFVLFNQFGTFVKVKIFVESKPVEVESVLVGDSKIEELDFDNLKIPIKTKDASKSISNTITATGKAYKGEKAQGQVNIYYDLECAEDVSDISLPVGQVITSATDNKSYVLKTAVSLGCGTSMNAMGVGITAKEFGDEYNITTINKNFTIQGYSNDILFAKNTAAITGGTKEEYTVLSQLDVDNAVESLSTTAIEEVKSELRETTGGWEIIEDTILSEVDKGSIKTDKKVGTEATDVNIDLVIKGTATYYQTKGLSEKLTTLLREKAEQEKLFENDRDIELVLGDEIDKKITVEESTKDSVKIKIVAKSSIKPKVDKDKLAEELKGMSWEEGKQYIDSLKYSDRKSEVVFNPMNYPAFLKRFPNRRGGVIISISELEAKN